MKVWSESGTKNLTVNDESSVAEGSYFNMYLDKVLGTGYRIATWNPEKRGLLATMKTTERFLCSVTTENLKIG